MKSKLRIVVLVVGLLFLGLLAVIVLRPRLQPPPEDTRLSVEQRLELLREMNLALGLLENSKFAEATPGLEKIVERLPGEPLGHRNLTIALFAPSDAGQSTKLLADMDSLRAASKRMVGVDGSSAAAHHLAARVHMAEANLLRGRDLQAAEKAVAEAHEHLQQAAKLSPQDPAPHFDIYELEKQYGNPDELSERGQKALKMVHDLAPDNLAGLVEWLELLCARNDPQRVSVAERLLRLLPTEMADTEKRVDLRKELEDIIKLLKEKPGETPPEVFQKLNSLRGRMQQQLPAYQQALSRLRPHPLEFVMQDFSPAFYESLPRDGEPAISVKFERQPMARPIEGKDLVGFAWEDLTSTGGFATVVLRALPAGTRVETFPQQNAPSLPPLEVAGKYSRVQLADLDLDILPGPDGGENIPADIDAVLYGAAGIALLENRDDKGARRWVDRTADAKMPALTGVVWLLICDVDHDGNLDLVVGQERGVRILRNLGAWAFEDITSLSTGLETLQTVAAVYGDFDRDGDLDLLLLGNRDGLLTELTNERSGRFSVKNHEPDPALKDATCVATFDVDNDGRLNWVVGHGNGVAVFLPPTQPGKLFEQLTVATPSRPAALGYIDFDNDGWLDLWVRTEDRAEALRLYRNQQGNQFVDVTDSTLGGELTYREAAVADVDGDGGQDFLVLAPDALLVLRNVGGNQNHWIDIRLRALLNRSTEIGAAAKCNYWDIGGTLEVKAGTHYQLQEVTGSVTHFGLGKRSKVDVVRVIWTNGVPQAILRPPLDTVLNEDQKPKGSCPFLFTWDGEKFVWVTDCLWSSALGMKLAQDVYMDHQRQENYLVVPGELLQPQNQWYTVRFTNELWEVPYLDAVHLKVVDHPADVAIYTNQRVPPNPNEPFKIITVRQRRTPLTARDHQGRDVLEVIKARDGDYLGGFRRNRYVGLADAHWLELDLGDLSDARQATLFLTGWVWPTDTTGNVAISQDPRFRGPTGVIGGAQPPRLEVPDGKGGWATAIPMMGFQSGKLQTVAVELPLAKFPKGDYRVRIATRMELYWDEAFFTVDEQPPPLTVRELPVAAADLHYRGYTHVYQDRPTSPHLYDYQTVDPNPRWLPIPGHYTRYGNVTELLHKPDSRYVVMSPGDELSMLFAELPPPAAGMKRTFIWYGNGWLKDFDMNGGASDRVGPYPHDGMKRYPYQEPAESPRSAEFEEFRRTYLTREEDPAGFWDLLRPR